MFRPRDRTRPYWGRGRRGRRPPTPRLCFWGRSGSNPRAHKPEGWRETRPGYPRPRRESESPLLLPLFLKAAAKYPALISMAPDGAYQLTTLFLNEISKRKNALHAKREADKAVATAKRAATSNAPCATKATKRKTNHGNAKRAKSRKPNSDPTPLRGGVGAQT